LFKIYTFWRGEPWTHFKYFVKSWFKFLGVSIFSINFFYHVVLNSLFLVRVPKTQNNTKEYRKWVEMGSSVMLFQHHSKVIISQNQPNKNSSIVLITKLSKYLLNLVENWKEILNSFRIQYLDMVWINNKFSKVIKN